MTIASNMTNSTPDRDIHPNHHNQLAEAVNTLVTDVAALQAGGGGGVAIPEQGTAPSNPSEGDLWIDTSQNATPGVAVPAPQSGDAGKVLTVNSGATGYELDHGGTSVQTDRAIYTNAGSPGMATGDAVTWSSTPLSHHGRTLLDFTDPQNPTVLIAGIYAMTCRIQVTNVVASAGKHWALDFEVDTAGDSPTFEQTEPLDPTNLGTGPTLTQSGTWYVPLGGSLFGVVSHDIGSPIAVGATLTVQLIG